MIPALLLHVVANVVHVDLGVQQGGEMSGAQLCCSSHFQVVQIQPEVGLAHGPALSTAPV